MGKFKNWMLAPLFLVSVASGIALNLPSRSAQARSLGDVPGTLRPMCDVNRG